MSEIGDNFQEHLDKAIAEWLTKQGGGMVDSYAIILKYYAAEGEPAFVTSYGQDQHVGVTLGLLRWQTMMVEHQVKSYLQEDEDG